MSGIPRNSERDWSVRLDALRTLLCRSIRASFVDFVLLFSFHHWNGNKSYGHFLRKREWHLKLKNMKMYVRVVQSLNNIVWPRPFLTWPNLKSYVGHINQFDQFLDWTLRVLDIRLQYWERGFFSKWHRRLGRKVIQILPTGDEPMTFCLLQ